MKKILSTIGCAILCLVTYNASAQQATIKVDTLRQIGEIDRNIYGVFMEPIRNTMDGILYDPDHPLANEDGFRTDYIQMSKDLEITNMRWPGGNYTATYHWKDGIGPKEDRPVRREVAWNVLDRNHVGTDEWIALSRAMDVENSIAVNAGTGTLREAKQWIEYVNSPTGSYWADLRAKYGHPEPFDVKYWHIGNEVDGEPWQAVSSTSYEYVRFAKNAANLMYFVNRACESCTQPVFLAMGTSLVKQGGVDYEWEQWNWDVINGLITQQNVEFIALHRYWGQELPGLPVDVSESRKPNVFLGDWAEHIDDYISTTKYQIEIAKIKNHVPDKPFHIGFTEWSPRGGDQLEVLAGALHFNLFLRHADAVKRANYTMFISLLGRNENGETYKTPFYHMFKLYSTNAHGKSLDTYVKSDSFDGELYTDIPYLDVSSSYSDDGKMLVINVINRNMDEAITTNIISDTGEFAGEATVSVINNDDVNAEYSFDNRDQYSPSVSTVRANGESFEYSFAPHSFTQIRVELE